MLQTIIWDIDDVLNNLTKDWLEREWLPRHPDCSIHFDELKANPPHVELGISLNEYQVSLDNFRTNVIGRNLSPSTDAIAWFEQYGSNYRHIALTARPFIAVPPAAEWLFRHFGKWIRGFGFVPSSRAIDSAPIYDSNKGEWLQWVGVGAILVDDSPNNQKAAQSIGLKTILIPQPWNNAVGSTKESFESINRVLKSN